MPEYFEFEACLLHVKPRIWHRFLLRKAGNFQDLNALGTVSECFGYRFRECRVKGGEPCTFRDGTDTVHLDEVTPSDVDEAIRLADAILRWATGILGNR